MPPFKSAINIGLENVDTRNRVACNFLCSLMYKGNDFQNQNNTGLFSGPYISAGAHSVIPENFEQSMVIHTVRRLPPELGPTTEINSINPILKCQRSL